MKSLVNDKPGWRRGVWNQLLTIILALAIVGALATLGYMIISPNVGEGFTEFYILSSDNQTADYPKELMVSEESRVLVGIINRENTTETYRVEITIDGEKYSEIGPVILEDDEAWQSITGFIPHQAGDNQKVEFLLYRQGQSEVYQRLYLWVDVR